MDAHDSAVSVGFASPAGRPLQAAPADRSDTAVERRW